MNEFVAPPDGARQYTLAMRPGLGDCAPSGRMRLDALARWLQDVAYADVEDAGLALSAVWVVRRNRIAVHRFPRFAERFIVRTFCSGLGRMWAERRTTVEPVDSGNGDRPAGPAVDAVALWVHLDPTNWRPTPFTEAEIAAYGNHAEGRRVTARLRHPAPAADAAERRRWTFRATECDIADHVNNAAYWQPLEEEFLARDDDEPTTLDVEIEFRTPCQPGEKLVLADGDQRWITSPDRDAHASLRLPLPAGARSRLVARAAPGAVLATGRASPGGVCRFPRSDRDNGTSPPTEGCPIGECFPGVRPRYPPGPALRTRQMCSIGHRRAHSRSVAER